MTAFILGGGQTDFARKWDREQLDIGDMMAEAVLAALGDSGIPTDAVQVAHVGNFTGELFRGQGHLGALLCQVVPELGNIPASRHEAACASGSVALQAALADLAAGYYDVALVVGVEEMRNVPGQQAATHLGAAARVGRETDGYRYLWPGMFSKIADAYADRYGLDYGHLGAIAKTNLENARRNPRAQARTWRFEDQSFQEHDDHNPIVEGRIRRNECGQVTDGAAALVIASPEAAAKFASRRGVTIESLPRISGWAHGSHGIELQPKLRAAPDQPMFGHVAEIVRAARRRAGLADGASPSGIDGYEVHDCFAITELIAIELLGLATAGCGGTVVESGDIAIDGKSPINPSGGLIGCGHPVGATGVRMVLDASRQVAGTAGDYQIANARTIQTLNIGGSFATSASFVVQR